MSFLVEMVVDCGEHGDEFLRGSYAAEPLHGLFSSLKRIERVLGPIVLPTASVQFLGMGKNFHRGTGGLKFVG